MNIFIKMFRKESLNNAAKGSCKIDTELSTAATLHKTSSLGEIAENNSFVTIYRTKIHDCSERITFRFNYVWKPVVKTGVHRHTELFQTENYNVFIEEILWINTETKEEIWADYTPTFFTDERTGAFNIFKNDVFPISKEKKQSTATTKKKK